jgi:hypothetical protein
MQNYTNISVTVDGTTYYATQASFNVSTSLEPVYALGQVGKVTQNPNGPIKGTLSLDYHIDQDAIATLFDTITTTDLGSAITPVTVSLGGQSFSKAYLTSHGANGQANQLATAKATFDLYFASTSQAIAFGGTGSGTTADGSLNLGHGAASSVAAVGGISDAVSFSYESSIQYDFVFKMGSVTPASAYVSRASKKMTVEGYSISANISMCGDTATATATVNSLCGAGNITSYSAAGEITQLEGSVSAGQVGRGKVTVTQFI